jgi:hypothetical protein
MKELLYPTAQAHQECDHGADEEYHEKNLRDAGSADRYSTEAKERGDERDYKEYYGIVKHWSSLTN